MNFEHTSVLLYESIDALSIKPDGVYVDATMGGAGHSLKICEKLGDKGHLIGIDQDCNAIAKAKVVLSEHLNKVTFVNRNFSQIKDILQELNVDKVDGVLIDLGVSSHQLDEADRGFSYMQDAKLDMRMDQGAELSAYEVVNEYSEKELEHIIMKYGEERWAKRIAEYIAKERSDSPIQTTFQLVSAIKKAIPKAARENGPHPAKRTFQAIRIEVNNELEIIKSTIEDIAEVLNAEGRIAIITFHSLEDRIVKHTFRNLENPCTCQSRYVAWCICGKEPSLKVITRKPVLPSDTELSSNHRARSAKLRISQKYNQ